MLNRLPFSFIVILIPVLSFAQVDGKTTLNSNTKVKDTSKSKFNDTTGNVLTDV
ncbi:MAG: hypothetical protein RLZZ172_2515, partial [Bacteroidota bacterium]